SPQRHYRPGPSAPGARLSPSTVYTCSRVVEPGSPVLTPAVMTTRSPLRRYPPAKAAFTATSIMSSIFSVRGTTMGWTPQTSVSWRATSGVGVKDRIGALGRDLDTMRAVAPDWVDVRIAAAPTSVATRHVA